MSEHNLDEFYAEVRPHGPACSLGNLIAELDDDKKATLQAALADSNLPATAISAVLSRWVGRKVTHYTLRRHRNGDCSCG